MSEQEARGWLAWRLKDTCGKTLKENRKKREWGKGGSARENESMSEQSEKGGGRNRDIQSLEHTEMINNKHIFSNYKNIDLAN